MRIVTLAVAAVALFAGSGFAQEDEHGPSAGDFLAYAYELLAARQPEKALAYLQYALDYYPLDRGLALLYLDVLREEGLEIIAQPICLERLEDYGDEPLILYANGFLADDDAERYEFYNRAVKLDKAFAPAYVGVAEIHFRRGDLDAAEETLARALDADPACGLAYNLRGEISVGRGELEKAVDDFEQALKYSRYAPAAHANLAAAYLEMGRAEAARDEYRAAIAVSDDRGEYYLGLGRALEGLGEFAAARLAYETAFSRAYGNLRVGAEARKAAGRLAFEAGDLVTAAEYVGWAVAFIPDDAELHAYLGGLYAHVGKRAEAAAEFKRAAELEPENVDYQRLYDLTLASIGEFKNAEEAAKEVVELLMAGRREEALTELELGLEQYPLDTRLNLFYLDIIEEDGSTNEAREIYEGKLKRWGEEPIILVALGRLTAGTDLEEAESKYNRALEVGGPFATAYVGLAEVGLRRGRAGHLEAEKYVMLSLATDGGYTRPYRIRGSICVFNDSLEDAVSNFKLALEGEPYDPVARGLLAQTYADLGNREAAVEEYRKAIYYNGSNYAYHWGLAGVLRYLRRYEEARQAYENAALYVKDDKLKTRALDEAADLAVEEGNYSEAARYLVDALKFSPQDRSLRSRLGRALVEQKKYDEAITELELVLDSDPDDAYAWYVLGLALEAKGDLVRAESALANAVRLLPVYTEIKPLPEAERKLAEVREALAESEEGKAEE